MARRVTFLLAVLLTTILLAGCGGQDTMPVEEKEEAAAPQTTTETTSETTAEERKADETTAVATAETTAETTPEASSAPSSKGPEEKAGPSTNVDETVTVTRVVDGDTIEISPAIDGITDLRLIGVDTPETKKPNCQIQPYGPEASSFTQTQLGGRQVGLEFDVEKTDRYDRLLAYVYPPDGSMFNETLLEEGYARVATFPPNTRYVQRFETAEAGAEAAGLGIWSLPPNDLAALLAGRCTPSQPAAPPPPPQQSVQEEPITPIQPAAPPAVPAGGARCSDFATEAEALAALPSNPQLDRDGDGRACESLP